MRAKVRLQEKNGGEPAGDSGAVTIRVGAPGGIPPARRRVPRSMTSDRSTRARLRPSAVPGTEAAKPGAAPSRSSSGILAHRLEGVQHARIRRRHGILSPGQIIGGDPPVADGTVMIIGGAEDKVRDRVILNRFAALAGGADGVVVVISTASSLGFEAGERYREVFTGLGIKTVRPLHAMSRSQANDPAYVRQLDDATGIFLTGGNQLRLSSTIGGTLLAEAVMEQFRQGAVVAGTSAGASTMSSHMIAFGASGATPKHRMAQISAGLGLLPGVIVDQHFQQRNRLDRLLHGVIAQNPSLLGRGVSEEDTAGVVGPRTASWRSSDAVAMTVVDGARVRNRRVGGQGSSPGHDHSGVVQQPPGGLPLRPAPPGADRRADAPRPARRQGGVELAAVAGPSPPNRAIHWPISQRRRRAA